MPIPAPAIDHCPNTWVYPTLTKLPSAFLTLLCMPHQSLSCNSLQSLLCVPHHHLLRDFQTISQCAHLAGPH